MGDLKEAIENVINNAIEVVSEDENIPFILEHGVIVPKVLLDELVAVYNICFVEPEDDLEFQNWRKS